MYEKPVCSALLPNTGVADLRFCGLAVFRFLRIAHRDSGPSQRTTPADMQIFAADEAPARSVGRQLALHSRVIFLPSVIGERRQIVKDQAVILSVELCRCFRAAAAPRSAIA